MTGFVGYSNEELYPLVYGEVENDTKDYSEEIHKKLKKAPLTAISTANFQTKNEPYSIAYHADLPIDFIEENKTLKRTNWMTRKKLKRIIGVTGFVKPLMLDEEFRIIDGQLRLEIIKELAQEGHYKAKTVPVVIYKLTKLEAENLRVKVNRMGEYARWDHQKDPKSETLTPSLPEYIDSVPHLQKLLEPLGFYSENYLPDSYFASTVLAFEEKIESPLYNPSIGLLAWNQTQKELQQKKLTEENKSPLKAPGAHKTLASLAPKQDDYTPVYAIEDESEKYILSMRDLAQTITTNYDAERKAIVEAKGGVYGQSSRRGTKQKVADMKNEALEEDLDFNETLLTPTEPAGEAEPLALKE